MRGAIIGDVAGSPYEGWAEGPAGDFPLFCPQTRFTDDSVCTAAVADAILNNRDFGEALRDWAAHYPDAGYGEMFALWARGHIKEPYGSFGNGAPMRVSPCAWLAPSEERSLYLAARSCAPTTIIPIPWRLLARSSPRSAQGAAMPKNPSFEGLQRRR